MIEEILFPFKKVLWRKKNKHNFTKLGRNFSTSKVKIGKATYGTLNVITFGNENEGLEIGSYCSIAENVTFLLSGEHNYKNISTYPFKNKILNKEQESMSKGKITVEDDVWIGYGATILSGVTIGQGAIIGAQSIVTKNIPPYAIYVGNKIIKYRFEEDIIKKLLTANYNNLSKDKILKNIEMLYEDINKNNVEEIVNIINEK